MLVTNKFRIHKNPKNQFVSVVIPAFNEEGETAEGHIIGNHSFNHARYLNFLSAKKFIKNIGDAEDAIATSAGVRPKFFRPPYGLESPLMAKYLKNKGYHVVLWNDGTEDYYMKENSNKIAEVIIKKLKPGSIIDLHDGRDVQPNYPRENLVGALPIIINKIREKGYTLVTINKIIRQEPYF